MLINEEDTQSRDNGNPGLYLFFLFKLVWKNLLALIIAQLLGLGNYCNIASQRNLKGAKANVRNDLKLCTTIRLIRYTHIIKTVVHPISS